MEFHDPIESCPYNVTHRVRRSRMQFHITTCAQNHSHTGLLQCPFDARHVIKRTEFEHHKSNCPARVSVIDYAIHDAPSQEKLKILPIDVNPVGQWDEKWDDGPDVKTYDPIQYIKNKPIVRALIGVSKAKRKNHRLQERMRYQTVMENEGKSTSHNRFYSRSMSTNLNVSSTVEVVHEIGDNTDEGYKPLRPPINFLVTHAAKKTFDINKNQTFDRSVLMNPETKPISSNNSSSSVAALFSNDKMSSTKKSLENCEVFEKLAKNVDAKTVNSVNQGIRLIPNKDRIAVNKDDNRFNRYRYKDRVTFSIPDTDSTVFDENDDEFYKYRYEHQEKCSTLDTLGNISSTKNEYRLPLSLVNKVSEMLSSSSIRKTSEIDPVIHILSKTSEQIGENNQINKDTPISDAFFDFSTEDKTQFLMSGDSDMLLLSSTLDENLNDSLSYGTVQSTNDSINSINTKSNEEISIFEKLSKTIEKITMDDKGHKKKSESLNQQIDMLKKIPSKKKSKLINVSVDLNGDKLFPKCGANFFNLKQ